MAYDMGEAIGKVSLDVSGVEQGTRKAEKAFNDITKDSDAVIDSIQRQAEAFEYVLGRAYQDVEQKLSPLQRAQKALDNIYESNREKVELYDQAAQKAAAAQIQANDAVSRSYQDLLVAQQLMVEATEKYNKSLASGNQADIARDYADFLAAVDTLNKAEMAYTATKEAEVKITEQAVKAQREYQDVLNATKGVEERAQSEMNKLLNEATQTELKNIAKVTEAQEDAQAKIEQTKIKEAEKTARYELDNAQANATKIAEAKIREHEKTARYELDNAQANATKIAQMQIKSQEDAQAKIEQTKIKEAEKTARYELDNAQANATKIAEAEIAAEAKVEKAKIDAAQRAKTQELAIQQKAQSDREKAEIAAEAKIKAVKIREAEKAARQKAVAEKKEREKATREAEKEQEDAAKQLANQQATAFAIAANAVHETLNLVKTLAKEMLDLSKQVVTIGSDFETSMAQVAATSGMTAGDIKNNISDYADLVSAAKEAGLTTVFSASQAGEALNYLALAGYNVEESIATMPDILTIAAAGAMDLGRASDMVTDAMNALDLSIDDTSGFIDKMAKTAQSSNTNVEQLGNAILTVGGTATVLAGGVTELDTALGVLANSGIKARQGGTALRQILLNLTDPSEKASKMIEQLGLKVFDMEGNMRPLNEIFTDLNDTMKDFTDQQRMEILGTIFDARQVRAATALMQGMGGAWDDLEEKISNAKGSAERMAETMRSNLNGAVNIAKSNIDSLAITIYEGISKNITDLVQSAIPQLQKLNEVLASPEMQSRLESMSAQIKEIGLTILNVIVKAAPDIISFLSNVQANLESLKVIIWAILSIKIVTHIMDIMKALQALYVVLATNPYVAVIAAVAALVVGIQQLTAAVEENHKAMVASIEAENDAYKEQRSQVQGVVDEWNNYKETSGEVTAEAEAQRAKVEALYEEYARLHNAGEDTTLAMEALANEIPELQQMLADGKTSFEDITGAVNDYCDALIRSAETEAGREGYIEAIKTRNALQGSIEDLNKAMIESGKEADEAKKRLESFESVFGTNAFLMSPGAKKEYEELKSKYESATNIYANNAKAYSDAAQTLKEADEAVESSRDMYYKSIQDSAKAEGKAYEDRNAAVRGINEQYSKDQTQFYKDQEAKSKEESQQLADSLAADIDGVESLIKQRLATDDDKIKVYEQFFDVDHTDWDRTCTDLVDAYDEYMTLREKKEKEVRDQMEKDQKERDKLAKEAQQKSEKAAKEAEKAWTDSINKGLSDIDWLAGYEDWDSDKLAEAYHKYLDDNLEYYESHAEAKEALDRKILETEKKSDEERAKDAKKTAEEYVKNWTSGYDKLVDRAVKAYQQLEKDADSYRQNLLKGVELTATETKKVWDMASHSYKDEQVEVVSAKSLQEDLEQMRKVKAFLDELRKSSADQSLIDQILGSSSEDQQKFMEQWSKMSAGERSKYLSTWDEIQKEANSMTEEYMSERVAAWEKDFWQPVQAYTQTGGKELQEAMKLVGEDSVQGWLDGITEKQTEAEGKTKELYGSVLDDAKKTLGIASPSKEFYAIGEYSIQGFLDGLTSKVSEVASVFQSLGQTAGDKFINAFKSTWDSFVTLLNNTGGLQIPVGMTTTTFGTPTVQGSQVYYTGTGTSYTGLTKADVISAIKEAVPDGNVILQVDEAEFGRISRSSLNLLAEQQGTMDLRV